MPNFLSFALSGHVCCILVSRTLAHTHGHGHGHGHHTWTGDDGGDDGDGDDGDDNECIYALRCHCLHNLPRLFRCLRGHNDDGCVDGRVRVYVYAYANGLDQVDGGSVCVWLGLVVIGILLVVSLLAGVGAGAGVDVGV